MGEWDRKRILKLEAMAKGSDQILRVTGALTDWITGWTNAGVDFRIQLTNLVTNWNNIANIPSSILYSNVDKVITSKLTFDIVPVLKAVEKDSFGADFKINLTEAGEFHLEPDVNFNLSIGNVHSSQFTIMIKQPVGGNVVLTLETGDFVYETFPVLSTGGGKVDLLICNYTSQTGRIVITDFLKNVTFN
jgi:hypothetical protein